MNKSLVLKLKGKSDFVKQVIVNKKENRAFRLAVSSLKSESGAISTTFAMKLLTSKAMRIARRDILDGKLTTWKDFEEYCK